MFNTGIPLNFVNRQSSLVVIPVETGIQILKLISTSRID